jgi:predicted phosphodiesterase
MEIGQGTRLAVLADLHGNGDALRAVLADLDGCGGADRLLVLGDIVLLGPDPGQVVELLMARDGIGVCGNTDRLLLDTDWPAFQSFACLGRLFLASCASPRGILHEGNLLL